MDVKRQLHTPDSLALRKYHPVKYLVPARSVNFIISATVDLKNNFRSYRQTKTGHFLQYLHGSHYKMNWK
jgi:hypothetical protein